MRRATLLLLIILSLFAYTTASADTIPGPITGNVTWAKADSPYILNGVYIPAGSTLTIEPGTIVKVVDSGYPFTVDGTLTIGSTGGEQVVITSIKDDTVGGDTNGDGSATTPGAGDWRAITVNGGAIITMHSTMIKYGGATFYYSGNQTPFPLIQNKGGTLTLDQVTLAQGQSSGIEQVSGVTTFTNSSITDCPRGIQNEGGRLELANNTFTQMSDYSVIVYGASNFINHGGNHGNRGMYMGYTIAGAQLWSKDNIPYLLPGMNIPTGASLTVEPGALLKVLDNAHAFSVDGTLTIGSTASSDNVFITSAKDDAVGGDTNGDGTTTVPARGNWRSLRINPGAIVGMKNTTVSYGGATLNFSGNTTLLPLIQNTGGTLTIDHVTLRESENDGIDLTGGTLTVSSSTFTQMGGSGIFTAGSGNILTVSTSTFDTMTRGVYVSNGTIFTTEGNTFTHLSTTEALRVDGSTTRFINHGGNSGEGGIALSLLLNHDTILPKDGLSYIVRYLEVPTDVTLTIMPGAVVKIPTNANTFTVNGTLIVGSSASSEETYITSLNDDTVGGDTNKDSIITTPASGDWRMIAFSPGSHATIANTTIRYGGASPYNPWTGGAEWYPALRNNGGTLAFDHATLINNGKYGIQQMLGTTTMTNSEVAHTEVYGIVNNSGVFSIHNSSIHDNGVYGLYNSAINTADATGNWWGSATGPTHPSNSQGTGDKVSDNVDFGQWLSAEPGAVPAVCTVNCYSNVLFLPGIMGSRLYDSTGNVRWLPEDDEEADYVRMNSDGTSALPDIATKDAIDTADGQQLYTDIYKSFLNEMKTWEHDYHITATTTPYDWRLDYDTVVTKGRKLPNGNISYLLSPEAGHDPYILETLKQLAATSKTGKVTIIGHSQGGLIAKALMQKIGDVQTAQLIDKVILVATPQLGTPKAITVLLNGTEAEIPLAVSAEKVRQLAQNTQSAYNLLPSANYFTRVDDPVITISSSSIPVWAQHYGDVIHWDGGMRNFMYDADVIRSKPTYTDLNTPEVVDPLKLLRAQDVHTALDRWTPPAGVQLVTVAGWGLETLSGIRYYRECKARNSAGSCVTYDTKNSIDPQHVIDGDGTVVEPSAQWVNGVNATQWWVNLPNYNADHRLEASPKGRDHKNILEVPQLRALLWNVISGTSTSLQYIFTTAPAYDGTDPRLHFTLHSPLTLGFTDSLGNYTGSTATGTVSNIPGAHYERYGEVQWLSIPKELAGQLIMQGTGSGSFTLDAEEVNGNMTLSATSFEEIPSATSTIVTMNILPSQSVTASSTLVVDYDGDRIGDITLNAEENGVVALPISKIPLTITPDNKTIILSFSIPSLTVTISGFIDGDILSTSISGSPSCTTTATTASTVGTYPITCTIGTLASDKYDFTTFATGTLTILYKWTGFTQPVNDTAYNPTQNMSVFKGGSTVPVKFQLKNANDVTMQSFSSPIWLSPQKLSPMSASVDESSYADPATSGTTYKYDAGSLQYIYNWSTKGLATGYWYKIYAKLDDGTTKSVTVGIR